jgi:hypothetical protein
MEEKGRSAGEQSQAEGPLKITAADTRLHILTADLPEEDDVVSIYRRREAAWISLITHAIIIALLIFIPKWDFSRPVIVPIKEKQETTFIPLPDDLLKVKPPKTNITSDKNRIAQTKTPTVDKETLRKLMDARKAGPPKASPPPPAESGNGTINRSSSSRAAYPSSNSSGGIACSGDAQKIAICHCVSRGFNE